jgi:hypothetical protein
MTEPDYPSLSGAGASETTRSPSGTTLPKTHDGLLGRFNRFVPA